MNQEINNATTAVVDKLESWANAFIDNIPNLVVATVVMIFAFVASRYISKFVRKIALKRVNKVAVAEVIGKLVSVVVVLAGLIVALGVLNLSETLKSLLTGAGIAGIVIGMALQGTLANTIAGLVISFRKKIRIGDWVETNGFAGQVMEISLREFTIKEADNNIVVIPNKTILENPLKNYTLTTRMRVMIECGVGYESDLDLVENVTKNCIANAFDQIEDADDVEFYYTEFGGSSINFLCRFWIDAEDSLEQLRARSKGINVIRKAFAKDNINIPFPIRTLQFDNNLDVNNLNTVREASKN